MPEIKLCLVKMWIETFQWCMLHDANIQNSVSILKYSYKYAFKTTTELCGYSGDLFVSKLLSRKKALVKLLLKQSEWWRINAGYITFKCSTPALKSRAGTFLAFLCWVFIMKPIAGPAAGFTAVSFIAAARQLLPPGPIPECGGGGRHWRRRARGRAGRGRCWGAALWRARPPGRAQPQPRPSLTRAAALPRLARAGGRGRRLITPWGSCRRRTARRAAGQGRAAPAGKVSQPAGPPGAARWRRRFPKGEVKALCPGLYLFLYPPALFARVGFQKSCSKRCLLRWGSSNSPS